MDNFALIFVCSLLAQFAVASSYSELHAMAVRPKPEQEQHQVKQLEFTHKTINVAGQVITRSTPILNGLEVLGGEAIFDETRGQQQFFYTAIPEADGEFRLSVAEAFEQAMNFHPSSLMKDPYVERLDGMYDRVWLVHLDKLRPAYKIRMPALSLSHLQDIYIDADSGRVLQIEDSAQFVDAPARAFVYAPTSSKIDTAELQDVTLRNLVDVKENGFLQGEYLSVSTCCRYYTCPEEGECTDDKKRCALKSHVGARQTREVLSLPTDSLGLDALVSLPPVVHVDTVRCTYLPFARASKRDLSSNVIGFFDKPIDEQGVDSEMDRFSEIQAYFSVMSFFNYIRQLLDDKTWCLRPEAMSCNNDGSPVLDDNGRPKNPYRVFVNQLIPDMKLSGPDQFSSDNFIAQANAGKGGRDNPIVLNDFSRFSNAAFVPALSTLKKNTPRADEILSDLIKPYDHNVFFQGDKDFAYDGLVVFHEFMHAITTSLISKINTLGLDKWGIHSEPGALNEAWADYFAAAFTNNPKMGQYANTQDGYGEIALRDIDNTASCPTDVIGEIHNDGLIWSGALWEIRTRLKKEFSDDAAFLFDRAVLASLAQAKISEDFKTQSEKLTANIKTREGLGDKAAALADEVFKKRGVRDCSRLLTLSSVDKDNRLTTVVKPMLFVPSKNQIGLINYAPATAQFELGIPAGARSVTISWKQFVGATGALLGTETTPQTAKNMVPLSVMSNFSTPITWSFKGQKATASSGENTVETPPEKAFFERGQWHYTKKFKFDRCEQNTLYLSFLSNDFKYVMQNISVSFDIDTSDDRSDCDFTGTLRRELSDELSNGCTQQTDENSLLLIITLLILRLTAALRRQNHQ